MRPLHILVAEDESLIRLGLKHILQEEGHTVDAAEDGVVALELAAARTPDLALLDIKMPRLDGLQTARRLYANAPVPIVFLTAFGERELVERAAQLHSFGYLTKPVKEADLHAVIALAHRRFTESAELTRDVRAATSALADQQLIDRAKGLLMQREGLSELRALERLESRARHHRLTLLEAAAELIDELAPGSGAPRT